MYSVDAGAPLGGWFDWLFARWVPRPRYWYMLRVSDPAVGVPLWLGPQQMTERDATEWHLDAIEDHWGSNVRRYVWNGEAWVYG